jgi:hypothetical protein
MHNFDDDDHNIDLFASMPIPTSYTLFDINANTITSCPTFSPFGIDGNKVKTLYFN